MVGLVEHYVSFEFLAAVANEHRKGRRLLIGTTPLDAQRPVIWDMGAIAARGDQNAIQLFRKGILASVSVPGILRQCSFQLRNEDDPGNRRPG